MPLVGLKSSVAPVHFIQGPKPMPRRRKRLRMSKESHNCQETSPRTILSLANWDFAGQSETTNAHTVSAVFRESVHRVLEKIKNEPYFRWPNKMVGESMKRNQNFYYQYHQDHGHTMENCRNFWNYLDQLVQEGKLKHLLHHSSGHQGQTH